MGILRTVSRLAVGLLFVFSGYVKAVDPQGSAIKFGEYFHSLGLEFLSPLALTFAILLSAAELTMGLCLIARVRMRVTAWAVLLFMSFFTILTFFIAVNGDIVSDCGCFGDALKLSNWATFFKNVITFPFVLVIFAQQKKYKPVSCPPVEWGILGALFIFACAIGLYSNRHLPLIDFMAYKVGTNIPQAKSLPEGAEPDVYKTILVYEKDGVKKEFDDTNFPWEDSTWTFVSSASKLVKQGYHPPIYDFSITSTELGDITDSILAKPTYTLILTSYQLADAETNRLDRVSELADFCLRQSNVDFFAYSGSSSGDIESFRQRSGAQYPIHTGDGTTIKSMVRSNPGLMLIHNGDIVAKWANADFPTVSELEKILNTPPNVVIKQAKAKEKRTNTIIVVLMLAAAASVNFLKRKPN